MPREYVIYLENKYFSDADSARCLNVELQYNQYVIITILKI